MQPVNIAIIVINTVTEIISQVIDCQFFKSYAVLIDVFQNIYKICGTFSLHIYYMYEIFHPHFFLSLKLNIIIFCRKKMHLTFLRLACDISLKAEREKNILKSPSKLAANRDRQTHSQDCRLNAMILHRSNPGYIYFLQCNK